MISSVQRDGECKSCCTLRSTESVREERKRPQVKSFRFLLGAFFVYFFFGIVGPAQAAIGTGGATCTNQVNAASTTIGCAVATENIEVGNVAVMWFGGDNLDNGGNGQLVTSVTDTGSNTWTVQRCFSTSLAAAAGATVCVATSKITTQLSTGATILATHGSITAKAIVVKEFTVGTGNGLIISGTPQDLFNTTDPGLMSITGLTSADHLFIRATALERAVTTWTPTSGYTTSGCNTTTGGGAAANNGVCGEFRVITATTSSASDPTGTAVDSASIYFALKEVSTTISGTLYSDEGSTQITSGKTIKAVVTTSGVSTVVSSTTNAGSGAWSITLPTQIATGTVVTIFVDGDANTRAALVTLAAAAGNISGLDLYQNRVIVRAEGSVGVTNAKLASYDSDNDADIQFNASSTANTLSVSAGQELHVWTGDTFAPGGDITITQDFHIATSSIYTSAATTTMGGNYTNNGIINVSQGSAWTIRNSAADIGWNSVTYGNGLFVAISQNGTGNRVMTSPDGITWTSRTSAADNQWLSVTYGNGLFVAVANTGTGNRVMTSPDGITWTTRTSAADNSWYSVTYGNGLFVAISYDGTGNRVMTSPDGITWTIRTSAADNFWSSVTYGNGLFVAVALSGIGNRVMTSLSAGGAFVFSSSSAQTLSGTMTGTSTFGKVIFSGTGTKTFLNNASTSDFTVSTGVTVAAPVLLSISGNFTQGSTFTAGATTTFNGTSAQIISGTTTGSSAFNNVVFTGASTKTFVNNASTSNFIVDTGATVVAPAELTISGSYANSGTFDNGVGKGWISRTSAADNSWYSVTYGNGLFVAVSSDGTNRVMTSPDGITWTARTAAVANLWYSVTYGNGLFVAVACGSTCGGGGANLVMTSPDGITWTARTAAADNGWSSVTYGNGLFVAVARSGTGNRVMTSPDGITWTSRTSAADNIWWSVTYGNGLFVAVSETGTGNRVMTSPDGITWTIRTSAADNLWSGVTYGNGLFVAVSSYGIGNNVMTSPDGITWTSRTSAADWRSVTYGNGLFVATAVSINGNRVMTSPDGITWTIRTSAADNSWYGVTYGNGLFVAVSSTGTGNRVMTSDPTVLFSSTSAQSIGGTLSGASTLNNVSFSGTGVKTFTSNASTTNIVVNTGASVVAPSLLSISGNYTNSGTATFGTGTTTFNGTGAQTISGTATGSSAFGTVVFTGSSTKTFANNASTSNFSISAASSTVVAPSLLSISGDYTNTGTFTAGTGTTTFNGTSAQTATGTLSFYNLEVVNSTASTTFGSILTVSNNFNATTPGSILTFLQTATSTLQNATIAGSSVNKIKLRSLLPGTQFGFDVNGTYSFSNLDIKDARACGGSVLDAADSTDSLNNSCWNFIFAAMLLSGTLYADEGITPITTGKTLSIAIGTSTLSLSATTAAADGTWSLTLPAVNGITASTPILVYVDGDAIKATTFTKAAAAATSIANLNLYQNRVIVSHEAGSGTSTTLTDMSFYDNDNDTDIQYNASSTELIVNAGNELHIQTGKIFTASGTVTVRGNAGSGTDGSLHMPASSVYTAGGLTTLAGNFLASSTALYTAHASGTLFNATTTGKSLITPFSLGSTTFNGASGTWTFGTTSTTSSLTITNGTLTAPATTLTVAGDYTNNGTFTHNGGTLIFTSSLTPTTTYTGTSFDTNASGNASTVGIIYANGYFWVADYVDAEVYKYTTAGTYTGTSFDTAASGNSNPYGITYANGYFWVTDISDAEVYKYTAAGVYTGISFDTATSGNGTPYGTTYANGFFWITDGSDAEVYKYTTAGVYTGTSFDTAASGNADPTGITYANGYFWVADYVDAEVYRYTTAGTYTGTSFDTAASGNADLRGITYANSSFWVLDYADAEVYQYSTGGQRIQGTATGTSAFNNVTFRGDAPKSFTGVATTSASTTSFTIESTSGTVNAPQYLSVSGDFTNSTTSGFYHNQGTTTLNGTSQQTLSGNLTNASAFNNLNITNTSGAGDSTQSIIFGAAASTTGTLTMAASTSAQFLASATSTFTNINLGGVVNQYVWLRSSVSDTPWNLVVTGTQALTYVNAKDSHACSGNPEISAADGTSVDAGGNTCWNFLAAGASISSAGNQSFSLSQATTTISVITITDASTPSITAANDIRIKIATSTVNMRFNTTDTTATLGGTAAAKVSTTVAYEGDGSVLVLSVSSDFSTSDTLTIADLSFAQFLTVTTATTALALYTGGANDTSAEDSDDKTVAITSSGELTLADHANGQVSNVFTSTGITDTALFAFKLTGGVEDIQVTTIVFPIRGIRGLLQEDFTNVTLYKDTNTDGVHDGGDTQVGGVGVVAVSEETATVTFSTTFVVSSTTPANYILVGDIANLRVTDSINLSLEGSDMVSVGVTSGLPITETGSIARKQHMKGGGGGGGSNAAIGGPAPEGQGVTTGGGQGGGGTIDPNTGDTIGNELDFFAPGANGSPLGAWTNGGNAYVSDGVYATAAGNGAQQSYGSFGFNIPGSNAITGIAVKLEASGSTAAGTISVRLSWDGGSSVTSLETTGTLGNTDGVYTLGGPSSLWGRSWSPSEFTNSNFKIEVVANPSSNTIQLDALQVNVYHQATGGGAGGGGAVWRDSGQHFANVYRGVEGVGAFWMAIIRSLFG